jgi:creatinine amidohydrolase
VIALISRLADIHQRGGRAATARCYRCDMRLIPIVLAFTAVAAFGATGILLEDLTWQQAEKVLKPNTVVVIPIGAESKEHGPHLKLKNDWLMAEYLKHEVLQRADVVVAPTVNYHYYPAFVEYPGSTTLRLETARDLMVDICRSLARYGPRRFYALNTGVSTLRALKLSADLLAADGITLRYTDILKVNEAAENQVKQEEGGTHADEIETSMMLFIAPASVDMKKAVKDYHPSGKGGLSRNPDGPGDFSASGVFGDATLATRKKGEILVHGLVDGILKDIQALQAAR